MTTISEVPEVNKNTFCDLLRYFRTRAGITQQQLADLSTISTRAIRDLERGRAERPRGDTIRLLADALRIHGRDRTVFESSARHHGGDHTANGRRRGEHLTVFSYADDAADQSPWSPADVPDGDTKFEYKTMRLYREARLAVEELWADVLNREAACGWRLVSVDDSVAFLERRITDAYTESRTA
ncbi:helix-turn-helix transcriptional regulator [Sphaerisporangium sp. TRM90804]|uniref:helix-turn-helix domain-containing protein n=1 Tax=Sphaerisporangium sp. TRM90804 TaxID=3031113 RepID=UPI002448ECB2|nr:helix-turn-helix transcriptional regulator [Sphaerisporangium sp. TRM90804]MDH2427974.1 helix-turn-helix transcriptional regulator [Sphaerisporangium sp. TRM90804]